MVLDEGVCAEMSVPRRPKFGDLFFSHNLLRCQSTKLVEATSVPLFYFALLPRNIWFYYHSPLNVLFGFSGYLDEALVKKGRNVFVVKVNVLQA